MTTEARIDPFLAGEYMQLFVNRRAYLLQSHRPDPDNGKHRYFKPRNKATQQDLMLPSGTISKHLHGDLTVSLYAINPQTQRCKWMAIDADYRNAMDDLIKLQYQLMQDGVEPGLEMSRRGGHLWIFMATPQLAHDCRVYIYNLAAQLGVPVKGRGVREGIEVFPKHNAIETSSFGNAIRGPLGIHRAADRRFWFYGADYTVEAQMAYLKRLRKVTEAEMQRFIAGKEMPKELDPVVYGPPRELRPGARPEFCILDHVSKKRKMGRNYVTRCPSCARAGCDRSGDNPAILISNPRFYLCWAGCTKEMIREAVGQPIRARHSA